MRVAIKSLKPLGDMRMRAKKHLKPISLMRMLHM